MATVQESNGRFNVPKSTLFLRRLSSSSYHTYITAIRCWSIQSIGSDLQTTSWCIHKIQYLQHRHGGFSCFESCFFLNDHAHTPGVPAWPYSKFLSQSLGTRRPNLIKSPPRRIFPRGGCSKLDCEWHSISGVYRFEWYVGSVSGTSGGWVGIGKGGDLGMFLSIREKEELKYQNKSM